MAKIKILTNVKFAQTAGIAQVVSSFMDFIEKSPKNNISLVAVNLTDSKKNIYIKHTNNKTSSITVGTKLPNLMKVIDNAKNLKNVEKDYEPVISLYQKAIQKEKPNIVLINGTYYFPWCLLIAAEREGISTVSHYHGILAKETENFKKHYRKIFLEMERSFDKKDLTYIFPSKITKEIVEKEIFGHKIKKSYILPNPVPEYFFAGEPKINNKNIGIVSRWSGIKNMRFCEDLAQYNYDNGSKFVINIITDLDSKHKKYKALSKIIKFHKPVSNKKLANFYKNMGVLISPSHFETYGNVAKEALSTGTPAMVSNNMGVSETFKKLGLDDWIINFDSTKSVYKKIESVMGKTVDKKVKKKMKSLYTPDKIFNQIIGILTTVA